MDPGTLARGPSEMSLQVRWRGEPAGTATVLAGLVLALGLATALWRLAGPAAPDCRLPDLPRPEPFTLGAAERTADPSPGARGSAPQHAALDAADPLRGLDLDLDEPPWPAASPPRRERDFHALFLELDPAALSERLDGVLGGASTRAEQVALLRALLDRAHPRAREAFLACVASAPASAVPGLEPLPSTALGLLRRRAQREPLAREILEGIVWDSSPPAAPALRVLAASALAAYASDEDLRRMQGEMLEEREPAVRAALSAGLRARAPSTFAGWLDERLDVPAPRAVPAAPVIE